MAEASHKKRRIRRSRWILGVFGVLGLALAGFLWWLPWDITLSPDQPGPRHPELLTYDQLSQGKPRILVITAHPDDSEFYMAGTLLRLNKAGAELRLVVATFGDKGFYPFSNPDPLARTRKEEQSEIAKVWGAKDVVFLGFPDGRLQNGPGLENAVKKQIEDFRPDTILTLESGHYRWASHSDHRRIGETVAKVGPTCAGVKRILFAETGQRDLVVDITDLMERKFELLRMHKSQFDELGRGKKDFVAGIIRGDAETAGKLIGVQYGEGFRVVLLPPPSK
jgi:LmbE family N-acetylglucosaminyl deacetylase